MTFSEVLIKRRKELGLSQEAPCSGGICAGSVRLQDYPHVFNVSVVVSNGGESRAVPVAINLNLSGGTGASWLPVE